MQLPYGPDGLGRAAAELESTNSNGDANRATDANACAKNESGNKALALMVQPSVDYG